MTENTPKGKFTFKTAAFFFFISMAFELYNILNETTILGMSVAHIPAIISHLIYIGIFGSMGVGLWYAKNWGPKAVYGGTAFYSLDMLLYVLNRDGIEDGLIKNLATYGVELQGSDIDQLMLMITMVVLAVIACWWGFALFTHIRRGYFLQSVQNTKNL
ncbi:MAG: hypothetical protein KJ737_28060 [Proteobacteria bacterium]|nr:hypothetical protein [Pseudomonadota bacterium]